MLAAEFLVLPTSRDLSDRVRPAHCADRIIDYGWR